MWRFILFNPFRPARPPGYGNFLLLKRRPVCVATWWGGMALRTSPLIPNPDSGIEAKQTIQTTAICLTRMRCHYQPSVEVSAFAINK